MWNAQGFDRFWAAYPIRVGKLAARKVWDRLKPDEALVQQMVETISWQRTSDQWRRGFIPHPRTWLSQGRWLDEPETPLRLTLAPDCPHEPRCDAPGRSACQLKTALEQARKTAS